MIIFRSWSESFWSLLSKPLFGAQRYFQSRCIKDIWQRIVTAHSYPVDYLVLHSLPEQNWLIHYKDKKIYHCLENICIEENTLSQYVAQFPELPLYWILQDCEMEFRTINLEKVKWWDRSVLIKQVHEGEFGENDWVFSGFSKRSKNHDYLLAAIKTDNKLQLCAQKISLLPNPFAGIRAYQIEIATYYFEQQNKLNSWVIVILTQAKAKDNLTLIVFHDGAIILQRNIINRGWKDAIKATMRFLNRFGYEDDQIVSILTTGKMADTCIAGFEFIKVQPLDVDNYNPIKATFSFIPSNLRQKYFALIAPILTIRFALPLIVILLFFSAYFMLHGYFVQHDYQIVKNRLEEYNKKLPPDYQQKLKVAELFGYFQSTKKNNPSNMLKLLGQSLKKKRLIASQISWSIKAHNPHLEIKFDKPIKKKLKEKIQIQLESYLKTSFTEIEINWHNDKKPILMIRGQQNR